MPLGPKRAPGRYDVPVSKGAPMCWSECELHSYATQVRTDERNVILRISLQTRVVWETTECGDTGEDGVGLC
jgi:hypothetical protein